MIRKALEYIVGLSKPITIDVDGEHYSTQALSPVLENWPKPLEMSSLSAMVDYLTRSADCRVYHNYILHVQSQTRVALYLSLRGTHNQRVCLAVAEPVLPTLEFGRMMSGEAMTIMLQSKFYNISTDDRAKVLSVVGNITDGVTRQYSDDGMTQQVTVRAGVATKANIVVPNPVQLTPFRTFHEVYQPASPFIFRAQGGREDQPPQFALYEGDGGAWRNAAMISIKNWLDNALQESETEETPLLSRIVIL